MDWLLTGNFLQYGAAILDRSGQWESFNQVFPKLTKCDFYNYGASGSKQKFDALCVLPLNNLNEKIFAILWFWFYGLAAVTFVALVYRFSVLISPKIRVYLLLAQARYVGKKAAILIVDELSYGDFFVLYHVGKYVNPGIYKELLLGIYDALHTKNPYKVCLGFDRQA